MSLSLSLTSSLTAGINLTKPIEKNSALRLADETVWLLGGSDRRLHVYAEDKTRHMYTEVSLSNAPPTAIPCFLGGLFAKAARVL